VPAPPSPLEKLDRLIWAHGVSHQDVAERLGLNPTLLSRYLSGERRLPADLGHRIEAAICDLAAVEARS
jgi:hypothetical protein